MILSQTTSSAGGSELERLRTTCRRQAMAIDALREIVSRFTAGAQALKTENAELRAEAVRLRSQRSEVMSPQDRAGGSELVDAPIPIGTHAPAAARRAVVRALEGRVAPGALENVKLLVSELVTNSVRHSGAEEGDVVVVRVDLWGDRCRLEVQDPGADGLIAPRPLPLDDGSGMGLHLVQMLSERWGVVRSAGGPTRVWAQLALQHA